MEILPESQALVKPEARRMGRRMSETGAEKLLRETGRVWLVNQTTVPIQQKPYVDSGRWSNRRGKILYVRLQTRKTGFFGVHFRQHRPELIFLLFSVSLCFIQYEMETQSGR